MNAVGTKKKEIWYALSAVSSTLFLDFADVFRFFVDTAIPGNIFSVMVSASPKRPQYLLHMHAIHASLLRDRCLCSMR